MLEGIWGPKKKKEVSAKELPKQPRPFFSHHPEAAGTLDYRDGMPVDEQYATHRFLDSNAPSANDAQRDRELEEVFEADMLPLPSQGSVEQVGMRRSAAEELGSWTTRKIEDDGHYHARAKDSHTWKSGRSDQARPTGA